MFTVYYSNKLQEHKDKFIELLTTTENNSLFAKERILVQSMDMGRWLEKEIADKVGISANLEFVFPTSFFSQIYPKTFQSDVLSHTQITWRLMEIVPSYLNSSNNIYLEHYFKPGYSQLDLYEFCTVLSNLFVQYLFFRQDWLISFSKNIIPDELKNSSDIATWQKDIFYLLIRKIEDNYGLDVIENYYLFIQNYKNIDLEKLSLPNRVFIFGISSMPIGQLYLLKELSVYIDIYLFMISPSDKDWWNDREDRIYDKLILEGSLNKEDIQFIESNNLVNIWGKQGRNFLLDVLEVDSNALEDINFEMYNPENNLFSLKNAILELNNNIDLSGDNDNSIQIHSCYSEMREIEILYQKINTFFSEDPSLSLNDIIIMSPDINKYIPYIEAVFVNSKIPYAISDTNRSQFNPILSSLLLLFNVDNLERMNVNFILELLKVDAISNCFGLTKDDIVKISKWFSDLNINFGEKIDNDSWDNYNSWENAISKLLLGNAIKEENGIWQDAISYNDGYSLNAELAGLLAYFIDCLSILKEKLTNSYNINNWKEILLHFLAIFYSEEYDDNGDISYIKEIIYEIALEIEEASFKNEIEFSVIYSLLHNKLNKESHNTRFLSGRLNFCSLMPMRSIPFKVICLIGMNEDSFPRFDRENDFNLMQYVIRRGDRSKRNDDLYLFLETILSAGQVLYLSYIGYSLFNSEEKLPSIVISQLLEFFAENDIKIPVISHSLSDYRVDLPVSKSENGFLDRINGQDNILLDVIEIDDLINYILTPISFIFNRLLGVNFKHYTDELADSELFHLNKLDEYLLNNNIFDNTDDFQQALEREKIKGSLPLANFSDIASLTIEEDISRFNKILGEYKNNLSVKSFNIDIGNIKLKGTIPHLYQDKIFLWKIGSAKDKDIIKCWIYHLILSLLEENIQVEFYAKADKGGIDKTTFTAIDKESTEQQLLIYIQDYIYSFKQFIFGISHNIDEYFKSIDKDNLEEDCYNFLDALSNDSYYSENMYLSRILDEGLNFREINERTHLWFDKMLEYKQEEKLKI